MTDPLQDNPDPTPAENLSADIGEEVVRLRRPDSLKRLRDRIETAATEIERLRRENETLAERVRALEQRPAVEPGTAFVNFDQTPDQLREEIQGFIDAIDAYLARTED